MVGHRFTFRISLWRVVVVLNNVAMNIAKVSSTTALYYVVVPILFSLTSIMGHGGSRFARLLLRVNMFRYEEDRRGCRRLFG